MKNDYAIPLSPYAEQFYKQWTLIPGSLDDSLVVDQYLEGYFDVQRFKQAAKRFVEDYLLWNSHIDCSNNGLFFVSNKKIYDVDFFKKPFSNGEIFAYIKKPFNLTKGPLYRFAVIQISPYKFRILFVIHHLLISGVNAPFFFKEFSNYYNSKNYSADISLENQFRKLNVLSAELKSRISTNKHLYTSFWNSTLRNLQPISLDFLKTKKIEKAVDTIMGNMDFPMDQITGVRAMRFSFSETVLLQLTQLKKKYGITPYLYGQIIYAILLHLYTGSKRFCTSYALSIPQASHFIYGAQMNTSLIPFNFNKTNSLFDLLNQTKVFFHDLKQKGINHHYYPIGEVISLSSYDDQLLNLPFDQTNIQAYPMKFKEIAATPNFDVNLGLDQDGLLWIGQDLRKNELHYRVLFKLERIDQIALDIFIKAYQKLFIYTLDECIKNKEERLSLNALEDLLLSEERFRKDIFRARGKVEEVTEKNRPLRCSNALEQDVNWILDFFQKIDHLFSSYPEVTFIVEDGSEAFLFFEEILDIQLITEVEHLTNDNTSLRYKFWKDKGGRRIYCTCPKYWNREDPLENIVNMFVFEKIFEKRLLIQFLITVSPPYLENKGHFLTDLLKNVLYLFDHFSPLKGSLFLIMIQNNKTFSKDDIKEEIKNILEDEEMNLNKNQIEALEYFSCDTNSCPLFSISQHELNKNNSTEITQKILELPKDPNFLREEFFYRPDWLGRLVLSKTEDYIWSLIDYMGSKMSQETVLLCEDIKTYYQKLMEEEDFIKLDILIKKLKDFYKKRNLNFSQFKKVQKYFECICFLKKYIENPPLNIETKNLDQYINYLIDFILRNTTRFIINKQNCFLSVLKDNLKSYVQENDSSSAKLFLHTLKGLSSHQDLSIFSKIIDYLKSSFPDAINITPYIELLKYLNSDHQQAFLTRLNSVIQGIIVFVDDKLKVQQQALSINIHETFKNVCNALIKAYNEWFLEKTGDPIEKINHLKTLIDPWSSISTIRLLQMIEIIEQMIITDLPHSEIMNIQEHLAKLKDYQKKLIDDEKNFSSCLHKLISAYKVIKTNCENLYV